MAPTGFTLGQVVIDTVTGAHDATLHQIDDWSPSPGIQSQVLTSGLEVSMISQGEIDPTITFTTPMIKTLLDEIGMRGILVDSDVSNDGVVCYLRKLAQGQYHAGGSTDVAVTVGDGMLVPMTLTANSGAAPATIAAQLVCMSDGTNDAIAWAANASAPGLAVATEAFTLGPISINGSDLVGVQSMSLNFGITPQTRHGSGSLYPLFVAGLAATPTLQVTLDDASYLNTLGADGLAINVGSGGAIVYLRRQEKGAGRYSEASAQHIKLTINEGMVNPLDAAFGAQGFSAPVLQIIPEWDGSNDAIQLATASAIT